jgi:hypothetical protein
VYSGPIGGRVNPSQPLDNDGQSLPKYPAFHCSEAGRRYAFGVCFIDIDVGLFHT